MIIFGSSVTLKHGTDYTADNPIIGYNNLVSSTNIVADYEDSSFPDTNLANPSTAQKWKSLLAYAQSIVITVGNAQTLDYFGVAVHNFGSSNTSVNVQSWNGTSYTLGSNLSVSSYNIPLLAETGAPLLNESGTNIYSDTALTTLGDIATNPLIAFDGTTSQSAAVSTHTAGSVTTCYIGKDITPLYTGSLQGKRIFKAVVMGSNDQGFVSAITPTVTLTLYGKTGTTPPANSTDGTSIGTTNFTDTANESGGRTITSTDQSTLYTYVWVKIDQNGAANQVNVAELQIFEATPTWVDLTTAVIPDDDLPLIFRFSSYTTANAKAAIRLQMTQGSATPMAAVIYTGLSLTFQRRVYVGHTPIPYGRTTNIVTGMSEDGNFLGRIVLSESRNTVVDLKNLKPDWYRTYMEPFIDNCTTAPFFFAWRPTSYPDETGFCWLTSDAVPVNQLPNGMMSISLGLAGIAS